MVQVKSHLRGGSAPFSASQLDALLAANAARSRELAAAERDTQAFWIAEYFRQRTAADPNATWRAQLISWGSQDAGASTSLLA
jgi:exoribonuclease R